MPPIVGNLIVIAILAVIVGLAIRSLWKNHKNGGGCGGGCEGCSSCGCGCGCASANTSTGTPGSELNK